MSSQADVQKEAENRHRERIQTRIERGNRAEIALKEMEKAFEALEKDCFDTFRASDIHDDQGRHACRLYLRVLDDVKSRFRRAVIDGENARKELIQFGKKSVLNRIFNG